MKKSNSSLPRIAAAILLAGKVSVSLPAVADSQIPAAAAELTYADLADLAAPSPVVAHVRVTRATALKPDRAPGVLPGMTRFYVQAEVVNLIRGTNGIPAAVSYLADVANDARGRPVKFARRAEFLILGRPVAGRMGEVQLTAPDAQIPYTPARADRIRAILREAVSRDAPPRITGIGRAFHVPGSLPGESETQIFLQTADQRPVSLSILRRPGERPRWAVALTEIVDDSAAPPERDTLLWYRLACALPAQLPRESLAETDAAGAQGIRADYAFVLQALGPCARTRR
ncbi:hypothetical protein [Allosphingosinicella indica]|uniref:DUF3108 domain-containing protein n=1 Tax=Allosphingosinicella indica TaxID=941907 RepID=A0A1X7GAA8_9SPHN|nr:hypothetical protein [Allosphingosinicella indica]SMF66530.1 hypothetical protein SAMN06295910_1409 [Allosphingosinicella indica]